MKKAKREEMLGEIRDLIDDATSPDTMTKQQALDFLEEIFADIESRCDCLRDELENEK